MTDASKLNYNSAENNDRYSFNAFKQESLNYYFNAHDMFAEFQREFADRRLTFLLPEVNRSARL